MTHDDFLLEWKSDPRFDIWLKEVLKHRPGIPEHTPAQDNTEVWKSCSAERRGFDVWLTYLKVRHE